MLREWQAGILDNASSWPQLESIAFMWWEEEEMEETEAIGLGSQCIGEVPSLRWVVLRAIPVGAILVGTGAPEENTQRNGVSGRKGPRAAQ